MFVIETHVNYQREVVEDDPLRIDLQLLDLDAKRVHYFMRMFHDEKGYLAATSEQLSTHVDLKARRSFTLARGRIWVTFEVINVTDRRNACCIDDFFFEQLPDGTIETTTQFDHWLGITQSLSVLWEF